jgi:hypothetical protein
MTIKQDIKKGNFKFEATVGRMTFNNLSIDRYTNENDEVLLVLEEVGGKMIDSFQPDSKTYWAVHENADDGFDLHMKLKERFFETLTNLHV